MKSLSAILLATSLPFSTTSARSARRAVPSQSFAYGSGICNTSIWDVPVTAEIQQFAANVTKPVSQLDVATGITLQSAVFSNYTNQSVIPSSQGGVTYSKETFGISVTTCYPNASTWNRDVQFLIHGIGFDHQYWQAPTNASDSDYVKTALKAGYATIAYDRLGMGRSEHPDGLTAVQTGTEIAILASIVNITKGLPRFERTKTWIGVGHSFGSIQLTGIAKQHPSLLDKLVLTGYSASMSFMPTFLFGFQPTIAAQATNGTSTSSGRFAQYANDTSYWVSASPSSDLMAFFYPPVGKYFTQQAFDFAQSIKNPLTQGEGLTIGQPAMALPATKFTGEVFVVTGKNDIPFCGGDCYQDGSRKRNILLDVRAQLPAASKFAIYTPLNTGHGLNAHLSAPKTFAKIISWLDRS